MTLSTDQRDFEPFYDNLQSIFEKVKNLDSATLVREKAFNHFLELGLPQKNKGPFQYVSLGSLYKESFSVEEMSLSKETLDSYVAAESKNSYLVFINGFLQLSLSNISALSSSLVILPLGEALRSYGTFLQNRWSKTLREEADPFVALNLALQPRGAFIYMPPKVKAASPIQCLFLTTTKDQIASPRLQLFIGSQSEINLISSTGGAGFSNTVIDVALEERARLSYLDTALPYPGSEGGRSFSFLKATLKKESYLSALSLDPRRALTRYNYHIALSGENADASIQGIWRLKNKQQAHVQVLMKHEAPFCRSMQKFKGVLDDLSLSSFEGKIFVTQEAQKTEAYQLNNNLILGEYAVANSKPNLEIFADDVKASHGCTVSQLDKEQIFYLKSRGIPESQAKDLLVQGFIGELVEQVPYSSIKMKEAAYVKSSFL